MDSVEALLDYESLLRRVFYAGPVDDAFMHTLDVEPAGAAAKFLELEDMLLLGALSRGTRVSSTLRRALYLLNYSPWVRQIVCSVEDGEKLLVMADGDPSGAALRKYGLLGVISNVQLLTSTAASPLMVPSGELYFVGEDVGRRHHFPVQAMDGLYRLTTGAQLRDNAKLTVVSIAPGH